MPDWPKAGQAGNSEAPDVGYPPDFSTQGSWLTLPTALEGINLELRTLEHTVGRRRWEVRIRPGARRFVVFATGRALKSTPAGARPYGRDWSEAELERGIARAVERALTASAPGTADEIALASDDLYAANGRL